MSYHQLLNQLEELGLKNMRETLPDYLDTIIKENVGFVDAFSELTKKELSFRKEERDKLRLQRSNLPFQKKVNDFDFNFQPQINKNEILDLCSLRFMDTTDNILFIGNSGVGKTHLAISIALEAMEKRTILLFCLKQ